MYACLSCTGHLPGYGAHIDGAAASWCTQLHCWDARLQTLQLPHRHGIIARGSPALMGRWAGEGFRVLRSGFDLPNSTVLVACRPLVNRAARICHGAAQEGQVLAPLDVVQNLLRALTGVQDFEVKRRRFG